MGKSKGAQAAPVSAKPNGKPKGDKKKVKQPVKAPTPPSSSSDSDDTSEGTSSDETSEGTSSSDSSDDSSSESEAEPAAKAKPVAAAAKDESSDSDSSEDEKPVAKAASASDSSDDSDSDSSSDSEEDDEASAEEQKRKAEETATPAPKKTRTEEPDNEAKRNLFVGQLSWNVDEEWLRREFEAYGAIESLTIIYDKQSGRSKGFGYVKFEEASAGEKAKNEKHRSEIDGRAINVDYNVPRDNTSTPRTDRSQRYGDNQANEPSSTLFVANLSFDITTDQVGEEFGKFSQVLNVRLPTDRDSGAPKGFGYVEFENVEDAKKAYEGMSGASIMGRPIRLDYSTPRPPRNDDSGSWRGRGGRGGFDRGRGGRGGRGGDRGGRGGGRGRGGSTNRGGFGDFQGKKMSLS